MAEKILAKRFNKKDCPIIDHYTYVFVVTVLLMEGISHEVCSLAGTHKLNKLIVYTMTIKLALMAKLKVGLQTIRQRDSKVMVGTL